MLQIIINIMEGRMYRKEKSRKKGKYHKKGKKSQKQKESKYLLTFTIESDKQLALSFKQMKERSQNRLEN